MRTWTGRWDLLAAHILRAFRFAALRPAVPGSSRTRRDGRGGSAGHHKVRAATSPNSSRGARARDRARRQGTEGLAGRARTRADMGQSAYYLWMHARSRREAHQYLPTPVRVKRIVRTLRCQPALRPVPLQPANGAPGARRQARSTSQRAYTRRTHRHTPTRPPDRLGGQTSRAILPRRWAERMCRRSRCPISAFTES